jgi:Ca2+-binding RTX toxin-like protein
VKRYDVCADQQLADLTCALPGSNAFALRLLPEGGLLVADREAIHRLNASGTVVQTYDVSGQDFWFAANLAPDGKSFWSGDIGSGNFFKFDIASGAVLVGPIAACNTSTCLAGLCVNAELTAGAESDCTDGQDNDGDQEIDCQDEDCQSDPACERELKLHCTDVAPTIVGTNGDDVLRGTPGNDVIFGRKGNDRLVGTGGNDIICGGMGRDTLTGAKGRDELHGGSGRDVLRGGPGRDALNGGPGTDKCLDEVTGTVFSPECEN